MLSSHRTCSHNELKKFLKDYKLNNNVTKASAKSSMIINYQVDPLIEKIRSQQLQILQLRNQMLKKQIELKQKSQINKQMQKQLTVLRKEKQNFCKIKQKFENQRKINMEKIEKLEEWNQDIRNKLENMQPPKDRYQTCLRQLDQLKVNIQNKENVIKERDFYKYFYQEIKDLVVCNQYTAEEVRNSLRTLFLDINQRIKTVK